MVKTKGRSKSVKGGFGGWARQTTVGSAWSPPANNSPGQLYAHQNGNHFKLNPNGILVGGIQPAVQEMNGPGMHQRNTLVPPLHIGSLGSGQGNKIGGKRQRLKRSNKRSNKRRNKRGGFVFGGFPQVFKTALSNVATSTLNAKNAYDGNPLTPSASPWDQQSLLKGSPIPPPKVMDIATLKQAAAQQVDAL